MHNIVKSGTIQISPLAYQPNCHNCHSLTMPYKRRYKRKKPVWKAGRRKYGKRYQRKAIMGLKNRRRKPRRRTGRAATTGKAIVATTKLSVQSGFMEPWLFRVNGAKTVGPNAPPTNATSKIAAFSLNPKKIIELEARQFLYQMFKIFEITWAFRKSTAAKESGPIFAEYVDDQKLVLVPNLANDDLPRQGNPSIPGNLSPAQLFEFAKQQKGSKVIPLDRKSFFMKVPAMVVQNLEFQGKLNDTGIQQAKMMKMPWLELNIENLSQMGVGQIYAIIPAVNVNTFYAVWTDDTNQNGRPGATLENIAEQFKYVVTCKVKWGVKNKHLDASLGTSVRYEPNLINPTIPDYKDNDAMVCTSEINVECSSSDTEEEISQKIGDQFIDIITTTL